MKRNAIARIIIYSIVIVLLVGLLLTCLGVGAFMFNINSGSGEGSTGEGSVSAWDINNLDIEWAAGSITIQTGDTEEIIFTESGNFSDEYAMSYTLKNGTLSLDYARESLVIGFTSTPSKDLTITVPESWHCESVEIDGAALEVNITGITTDSIELDGAAMELSFEGAFNELDCDGASCELELTTSTKPHSIDVDGASCQVDLTLPNDCGYLVQMDGLGCEFDADMEYTRANGNYLYGDRHCQINVDGLSCQITIHHKVQELLPTQPYDGTNG